MAAPVHSLQRFRDAQDPVIDQVMAELRAGAKRSHWMWFVFPQLRGLGRSPTAQFYGIADIGEARAYLADPVLGERLRACTALVLAAGVPLDRLFGSPDDMKFRSCMTLFSVVEPGIATPWRSALERLCEQGPDSATLCLLEHL